MVHNCWRKKTTKTNCERSFQRHRPFNLPAKTPLTTDWGFSKLREALASKDQNGIVCWKHFFWNFNMYYREACCVRGIMTTDQSPSWLSDRESWIRRGGEVGAPEKWPFWSRGGDFHREGEDGLHQQGAWEHRRGFHHPSFIYDLSWRGMMFVFNPSQSIKLSFITKGPFCLRSGECIRSSLSRRQEELVGWP